MLVKLKDGNKYELKFGKIKVTMELSEDSDDKGYVKVLRTKEVFVVPIAIHPSSMPLPM